MEDYFQKIQDKVDTCYEIAENARKKGYDPNLEVESPQAKDLAGRVEKLVGPEGVAKVIRKLKAEGKSDDEIVFQVVSDILKQKIGDIKESNMRVERAIRVGLAIKTMGVVSAPLEGISKIQIKEDNQNNRYLSLFFAGPIRAAGGTTAALCVLIADFVRRISNIPKYNATDGEIGRYVEEVKLYDRKVHLQYPSSPDELRFAVKHLPVEINGDSTEHEEVTAFRDLPRIETNNIRGGACLVLNDGILLKAPKLLKIAKKMNLEGWEWLEKLKKIALKQKKNKKEEKKEKSKETKKQKAKFLPNNKYVADIIAGRPVFSHPSRIGGHRIRYGRSRNTGLAAGGFHPATMAILDDFVAIGTQLRIERPGKSASICPVDSIEPPIVKLKNGNVIKIKSRKQAKKIFKDIRKVLFLGDILFGYGEFAENNHKLVPSGYVEEWWALELEQAIEESQESNGDLIKYTEDPFNNIPQAEEAIKISKKFNIPLHPAYTDFWGNISLEEACKLREAFLENYQDTQQVFLKNEQPVKKILEKSFILHRVKEGKLIFSRAMQRIYRELFHLGDSSNISLDSVNDIFSYFYKLSSLRIRDKAPYFMGTRMGRPEKSQRKSMKGIHTLFPLSHKVGNTRLVEKALEFEKIKIDVCRKKCKKCGTVNIFNKCPKCGEHTKVRQICENCGHLEKVDAESCSKCGSNYLQTSKEAVFDIKKYLLPRLKAFKMSLPDKMKGIFGLTNRFKVPEPIEKGLLRAKNDVLVYKTAELRYDATDIPLTHFKPKEIKVSVAKLQELGYTEDHKGNPLKNEEQIVELKAQDVVLSYDCAKYFVKEANFLDDELEQFYKMAPYYCVSKPSDLIGHLCVGLAPHTSAGVIGRIVGFSPARSIYAHPYWHAAKRRNCDGDEDGIMLLLDPLLNFSRYYLPSKIGGRMDATLVIGTFLDPKEVDTEAHNVDTLFRYPLEFYKATHKYATPDEVEDIMGLVGSRLGKENQYEGIGFNIPTSDINEGPTVTAYKQYHSMDEKLEGQLHLAKIIKAVDAKSVGSKILSSHFNPDILGNLRKFSQQEFRCVKCNTKYRRPPLANNGRCPSCGGNIILTVNSGGIEKYIPRALKICEEFKLDNYTLQKMELINEYVQSLTNNPKIKQQKLSDFL